MPPKKAYLNIQISHLSGRPAQLWRALEQARVTLGDSLLVLGFKLLVLQLCVGLSLSAH